jgi:hypothetical protein
MKTNCWEFKECGREPGGSKVSEFGVCPAAIDKKVNGIHDGINGGRCCWALAGTLCGGVVQGTFSKKMLDCMVCDHYKTVFKDEKSSVNYKTPAEILTILGKQAGPFGY